jgi:hypothetical protein
MKVRDPPPLPLPQIAKSIEKITDDDEILSKIALRYLRDLRGHLDAGRVPPPGFFTNVFASSWPYEPDAPSPEEICGPPVVVEILAPPAEMGDTERLCLMEIQKGIGRSVKLAELTSFCRVLASRAGVRLPKKHIVSKARLLTWIADTYDVLESHFKAALADWMSTREADADADAAE